MQEEFHGITNENGGRVWRQLYGWGTLNVNIWAPSLSEVVGITGELNDDGCYLSAMQGINAANVYWADANGGEQWAYFKQFNASGGGEALWNACNQEITWLRTPVQANTTSVRSIAGNNAISGDATPPTTSRAVHPARRCKFHISRFRLKRQGESSLITLHLLSPKRHARLTCSVVNALTTAHSCYHLFVVEGRIGNKLYPPKKRKIIQKTGKNKRQGTYY